MAMKNSPLKNVPLTVYMVVVTGLIGVHSMHGRVHPSQACYNYLVLCCRPSPLAYPTDSTTLLLTSYLPLKTLVSRQQSTKRSIEMVSSFVERLNSLYHLERCMTFNVN